MSENKNLIPHLPNNFQMYWPLDCKKAVVIEITRQMLQLHYTLGMTATAFKKRHNAVNYRLRKLKFHLVAGLFPEGNFRVYDDEGVVVPGTEEGLSLDMIDHWIDLRLIHESEES
jgi:hypothetical protein